MKVDRSVCVRCEQGSNAVFAAVEWVVVKRRGTLSYLSLFLTCTPLVFKMCLFFVPSLPLIVPFSAAMFWME